MSEQENLFELIRSALPRDPDTPLLEVPGGPTWRRNGVTLHNTGNWLYASALLGRAVPQSPFWPGSMVVVAESGPPELVEVLTDVDREVLAVRAGRR